MRFQPRTAGAVRGNKVRTTRSRSAAPKWSPKAAQRTETVIRTAERGRTQGIPQTGSALAVPCTESSIDGGDHRVPEEAPADLHESPGRGTGIAASNRPDSSGLFATRHRRAPLAARRKRKSCGALARRGGGEGDEREKEKEGKNDEPASPLLKETTTPRVDLQLTK